jgi:hypothetical protein
MKDAGLRIRVQRELRDQFLNACRAEDRPAAQVLREFMRDYVTRNTETDDGNEGLASTGPLQGDLQRLKR